MATLTYPTGIKIFIDEEDITSALFGEDTIELTDIYNAFSNLDITSYVRYVGEHTLKITAQGGIGRVDARVAMRGEK